MKIVILGPAYPLRGGIAHYNALLASHLRKGHEVDIITFKRQYPKISFPGKTQDEIGQPYDVSPAPRLIDSMNPLNWIHVSREIRKSRPDLLIFKYWLPFFGPCFGTIAALCRRGRKTKVLCICDNVIPHERRPGDLLFTRFAFQFVDFFVVQSNAVERDLKSFLPSAKYAKIPHPIYEIFGEGLEKDEARRRLGLEDERIMLFFGYVRPYKGLHSLLEAMPFVLAHVKTTLYVVGEFYEDQSKYIDQIKNLGLEKQVKVVSGYVPNDQVSLYFSACDVVVLPYASATQSGIVQIAYQFDKPVIATNVGGLAEVVIDGQTGFIVQPNDPRELANAVMRFYDENRDEEFSLNVKSGKEKYSWEYMVQGIEKLVTKV